MNISRDEFHDAVGVIRGDIRGVQDRLDTLNGRTRANELAIVRLQERQREGSKKRLAVWGGIGTLCAAVAKGVYWLVTK